MKWNTPEIIFSRWIEWEHRDSMQDARHRGVYVLGRFSHSPTGIANLLAEEVVYIGETCHQALWTRWYQFDRSAFNSQAGHSGGWTYAELFGNSVNQLHVAAFPVTGLTSQTRPFFIRFVERKLIWDFILRWGCAPACNRK